MKLRERWLALGSSPTSHFTGKLIELKDNICSVKAQKIAVLDRDGLRKSGYTIVIIPCKTKLTKMHHQQQTIFSSSGIIRSWSGVMTEKCRSEEAVWKLGGSKPIEIPVMRADAGTAEVIPPDCLASLVASNGKCSSLFVDILGAEQRNAGSRVRQREQPPSECMELTLLSSPGTGP